MVPHVTEYALTAPNPPYCDGNPVGCVVCAVANVKKLMLGKSTGDLTILSRDMGARCRAAYGTCHGLCAQHCAWGVCCAYLELKAMGIPVGYSRLTHAQIKAQLVAGHPVIVAGTYGHIPFVSPTSYSLTVPAKGRSDSFVGSHGLVLYRYFAADDTIEYADADFGSPGRKVIPPYSRTPAAAIFAMYDSRGWNAVYTLHAPPTPAPVPIPAPLPTGVHLAYGGQPKARGRYRVTSAIGARERRAPRIDPANVVRTLPLGTIFYCRQTTWTGTTVGGSPEWHGDGTGTLWVHHSTVQPV